MVADDAILEHVGRYRITLREVVSRIFCEGADAAAPLKRLVAEGRLQARGRSQGGSSNQALPGGYTYYQLSLSEARQRQVPDNRARALGPRALHEALAILWFCCMNATARARLEAEHLERLYGQLPPGQYAHCLERRSPAKNPKTSQRISNRVYRLYAPGPSSRNDHTLSRLAKHLDELKLHSVFAPLVESRVYAFAVLVDTAARRQALHQAVRQSGLREHAHIIVEQAASPLTLKEAFRAP